MSVVAQSMCRSSQQRLWPWTPTLEMVQLKYAVASDVKKVLDRMWSCQCQYR